MGGSYVIKENIYLVEGMGVLPFPLSSSSLHLRKSKKNERLEIACSLVYGKVTGGRTPALTSFQAEFKLPSKPPDPWLGYGFCWGTTLATRTCTLGKPVAVPARVAVPATISSPSWQGVSGCGQRGSESILYSSFINRRNH